MLQTKDDVDSKHMAVSYLVGALSPVSHKGLHQRQKQMSIHILLTPHESNETAKFFKIHKNTLDMNIKHQTQIIGESIRYHSC